jgi:hypothetical protein
MNFTGKPPKVSRLNWPYANSEAELVVVINLKGIPER